MNRNYQLKAKSYVSTDEDSAFMDEMKDWFYSFNDNIKTELEEKDSFNCLAPTNELNIDSHYSNPVLNNSTA